MADEPPPRQKMKRLLTASWMARAVYASARLGIADLLARGPRTGAELAGETGCDPDALVRLLRALASAQIFAELPDGRFALTEQGKLLRRDSDDSLWALAVMLGEEHYRAWGEILHSVRTGKPAFDRVFGTPVFEFLADHPDQAGIFDLAMTAVHGAEAFGLEEAFDFHAAGTVADVGGGNGTVLAALLKDHERLSAILFDLPHVVERAKENLTRAGVANRCRRVGGDFFKAVPKGADVYLLRHIIHDWDDERAGAILANCRKAIGEAGTLILLEQVMPPDPRSGFGRFSDLNMLIMVGGRERTQAEFCALFERAGFQLDRVVPTRTELAALVARPA